jgi:hypothetical protein
MESVNKSDNNFNKNMEIVKAEQKVQRSLRKYTQAVLQLDSVRKKDTKPKLIDRPEKQLYRADGLRFNVKVKHQNRPETLRLRGLSFDYFKDALLVHYINIPIEEKMTATIECVNNGQMLHLKNISYGYLIKAFGHYNKTMSSNWETGSTQLSYRVTKQMGGYNPDKDYFRI